MEGERGGGQRRVRRAAGEGGRERERERNGGGEVSDDGGSHGAGEGGKGGARRPGGGVGRGRDGADEGRSGENPEHKSRGGGCTWRPPPRAAGGGGGAAVWSRMQAEASYPASFPASYPAFYLDSDSDEAGRPPPWERSPRVGGAASGLGRGWRERRRGVGCGAKGVKCGGKRCWAGRPFPPYADRRDAGAAMAQ